MYVCMNLCMHINTYLPIHLLCTTLIYIVYYIDSTVNDFNEENLSTLLQFGDKGNYILLLLSDSI